MRIKLNFPKNITAKSLYKDATQYTTLEELNALEHGRLVVAWDTPTNEDSPIRFYGFLKEILFSSDGSVAPWSETVYRTVGVDQLTFVENIPLGITEKR